MNSFANFEKYCVGCFFAADRLILNYFLAVTFAVIPKGLHHSAQGWPRSGLPWVTMPKTNQTLKGVGSKHRADGQ
jgi:hypothetical protein